MKPPENCVTVEQLLHWAESQMERAQLYLGHGFDNYWDESLAMMLHVLGLGWDADLETLKCKPEKEQINDFTGLLNKRINMRMPVAYLVNEAWFCGMPFYVNQNVLIPRSPLAELISDQFSLWFPDLSPERILDLCTGSACIGIACAELMENALVDVSDLSSQALVVAERNITNYGLQNRMNIFASDLFKNIPPQQYDLIVSNPPYVDAQDMSQLPEEYRHEPRMALEAGEDGLVCVHEILRQSPPYLSGKGILIVEVGNSQEAVMEMYSEWPFLWLEFERGGHGVFAIGKQQLVQALAQSN